MIGTSTENGFLSRSILTPPGPLDVGKVLILCKIGCRCALDASSLVFRCQTQQYLQLDQLSISEIRSGLNSRPSQSWTVIVPGEF
jgi:hypothetical protein